MISATHLFLGIHTVMCTALSLFFILCHAAPAWAICCFASPVGNNVLFAGNMMCLNGRPRHGWFCGVMSCNFFGCNCGHDCIFARPEECLVRCLHYVPKELEGCVNLCDRNRKFFPNEYPENNATSSKRWSEW